MAQNTKLSTMLEPLIRHNRYQTNADREPCNSLSASSSLIQIKEHVSPDQTVLYLYDAGESEEIHLIDRESIQITALTSGSISSDWDVPEQLYAFAQEGGESCVYAVSFPENSKAELTFYD